MLESSGFGASLRFFYLPLANTFRPESIQLTRWRVLLVFTAVAALVTAYEASYCPKKLVSRDELSSAQQGSRRGTDILLPHERFPHQHGLHTMLLQHQCISSSVDAAFADDNLSRWNVFS